MTTSDILSPAAFSKVDFDSPLPWIAAGAVCGSTFSACHFQLTVYSDFNRFPTQEGPAWRHCSAYRSSLLRCHSCHGLFHFGCRVFSVSSAASSATFIHVSAIILITIAYRLSPFHPLWNFPGPLINKVTSLKFFLVVYSGKRHLYIDAVHKKCGKFVRIGKPNCYLIIYHKPT